MLERETAVSADTPTELPRPQLPFLSRPTSPVGRTSKALSSDPSARDPLRDVTVDLKVLSDLQLHALTAALLEEKHRRVARWLPTPRGTDA